MDRFKTDVLECRFRELNIFNGFASPFFISVLVIFGQKFTIDPLYGKISWILYVSGA